MKRNITAWLFSAVMATAVVFAVLAVMLVTPIPSRADGYGVQRVILADTDCGCQQQIVQTYSAPIVQRVVSYPVVQQVQCVQSYAAPVVLRQRSYAQPIVLRNRFAVRERFIGGGSLLNINVGGPRRAAVRVGGLRLRVR